MKRSLYFFIIFYFLILLFNFKVKAQGTHRVADSLTYLSDIKSILVKQWPDNRTINLVFHGHSVPSGYFKTPVVNTLEAYPYLLLKELKKIYPYAVINIIITAIGGENSMQGSKRLESDVFIHKPDVLFIDYALNDGGLGLSESKKYWEDMIKKALAKNIKVILLTPSPYIKVNILEPDNDLQKFSNQIIELAKTYGIGCIDSYGVFKKMVLAGGNLPDYMSQDNHPNEKGHYLIATEIMKYFK